MIISVTEKHIKKGKKESAYSCPVALAIKEQLKCNDVSVFHDGFYTYDEMRFAKYHYLPKKATVFIERFDNNDSVNPFTFRVKV